MRNILRRKMERVSIMSTTVYNETNNRYTHSWWKLSHNHIFITPSNLQRPSKHETSPARGQIVFHMTQNTSMFADRTYVPISLHSINSYSSILDIDDNRREKIGIPEPGKPLCASFIHALHTFSINFRYLFVLINDRRACAHLRHFSTIWI